MRWNAPSPAALACGLAVLTASAGVAAAEPVTVESCGQPLRLAAPPQRAVVHDQNMAEIMFALGLQERMAGVTGITGWYKMTDAFRQQMGDLPELAAKQPTIENLLEAEADFFFAGWHYGMRPGGEVTPDSLAAFGIPVYVLSESCIHVDRARAPASMDLLYRDVANIGRLFGRETDAEALIEGWQARMTAVRQAVAGREPPRVFLFDSGEERPFTAGRFAMPTALIEAAGGANLMEDMETSWGRVGWEAVADRNPEFIILLDYQDDEGWRRLWRFLESFPPMAATDAVRNRRFLPLRYSEITPGPANIEAVEKLARALHPEAFGE